uniref:DUF3850 domain-containing protein n=1 Tax=Caenorhabditis tropicalis TaxID=1561998 RepID=A0A1I7TJH7_9PELO
MFGKDDLLDSLKDNTSFQMEVRKRETNANHPETYDQLRKGISKFQHSEIRISTVKEIYLQENNSENHAFKTTISVSMRNSDMCFNMNEWTQTATAISALTEKDASSL